MSMFLRGLALLFANCVPATYFLSFVISTSFAYPVFYKRQQESKQKPFFNCQCKSLYLFILTILDSARSTYNNTKTVLNILFDMIWRQESHSLVTLPSVFLITLIDDQKEIHKTKSRNKKRASIDMKYDECPS